MEIYIRDYEKKDWKGDLIDKESIIVYSWGKNYIEISVELDTLSIRGSKRLTIHPEVSNAIRIKVKK